MVDAESRTTPSGDSGRYRSGYRDSGAGDILIRRARWAGAALACVQFALYKGPPGHDLPYSRWWGVVPVAMLVAVNVAVLVAGRRGGRPDGPSRRLAVMQVVGDTLAIAVLLGMFTFDPTSALWTLLMMPVIEATVRGWSRGALVLFAVLSSAYAVREAVAAFVFHRPGSTLDAVTFRIGILAIVATATSGLAGRLTRQLADTAAAEAEAVQLRDLAVATRRMSSLDVPTVVREVTRAAQEFGFTGVELRSRTGGLLGERASPVRPADDGPSPAWFDDAVAAADENGYAVLDQVPDGDDDGVVSGLVVAPVTAGRAVEALLVARHRLPLDPRSAQVIGLLAAQAGSALGNALRYEEGRAYEQRLAHQATHDALTGLPNRTLLRDRLREALTHGRSDRRLTAVVYVDLDRFKEINDVLGHATGDRLLQQVARRVVTRLRAGDTCARVGGDEFVVVTGGHPDGESVLELARTVRAALLEPFAVEGLALDVEASLGVVWAPDHGDDVESLLRRADVAMYAAKTRREGLTVYQEADDQLTPRHLTTLGDLRRALDATGQLVPHFQPIIALPDGRLTGVEALARWYHPVRGQVSPEEFIPVAEGTTVIHQVTDRVLQLALGSLREWNARGLEIELAVNVSARALLDGTFGQRLHRLLDRSGAAPGALRLEITESTLLHDPAHAVVTMHRLRELGVRLSIDDFGTGYSSMSYLKTLPLDEIKIDRSFVVDMARSPRDAAVVHSVVDLAHSFGLRVVAEGVEDQQVLEALAETGCDMAQGFHIGRPMTGHQFLSWAERRRGRGIGAAGRGAQGMAS